MIPKQGKDVTRADNLRPVSLLSVISKVLERLLQRRVQNWLRNFDVLTYEQFGFRVWHSTTFQLIRLVDNITEAGCQKGQTIVCFLGVEKAFGSVWHDGLLFKLREIQLPEWNLDSFYLLAFLRREPSA